MLAPAEKNFSPWPVIRITETSSSNLALNIASSISCHISRVYVFTDVFPSVKGSPAESEHSSMIAIPFSVTP